MTTGDRFTRTLSTWLREEGAHRVPDHLAEVLVRTAATRQRPWWSSLERLAPMTTMTTDRVVTRPPLIWFALLALLALAVVGATLLAGALRSTPAPLGPPSNGRLVVVDGSTLATYAADGSDRRELLAVTGTVPSLSLSPDGTRVAYRVNLTPPRIDIVTVADGSITTIELPAVNAVAEEPLGWSPDGRFLTFAALAGRELVYVVATDGSSVATPALGGIDPDAIVWQPTYSPDGEWIAVGVEDRSTEFAELYVMRPDGTGLRALETPSLNLGEGGGPVWAPDPGVHRIAYLTFAESALQARVFDLDTNTDHEVGPGFWPSWSPDGNRLAMCCASIVEIDDVLAGHPDQVTVFEQCDGDCGDVAMRTGGAIGSAVVWSPDGTWLAAVGAGDLLLAPLDGSRPPQRIRMTDGGLAVTGFRVPLTWQPARP